MILSDITDFFWLKLARMTYIDGQTQCSNLFQGIWWINSSDDYSKPNEIPI
jgi:hypothetical protein